VPGSVRVLALGDSQTFGNGLGLADTWPKQLERLLNDSRQNRWEVLNAGVPGTDTWQHEILLRRLLKAMEIHVVILALYVNDVVPRAKPRGVKRLEQTNTWKSRLAYLLKRSAVVTVAHSRLLPAWAAWRRGDGLSTEDATLLGAHDKRVEEGWRQVDESLGMMQEMCRSRGIQLLLAIRPRRDQVSGRHRWRAYNDRARAVAEAHEIRAIDLLPSLSEAYRVKGELLFIAWDGHNSAAANRVIAERLSGALDVLSPGR
jgi:lysophospholipase L1-like esterase